MAPVAQTSEPDTQPKSFALGEDGDLPATGFTLLTGAAAVVQDVTTRLRFFRGEWFLEPDVGVPYRQSILLKNPNMSAVRTALREAIEEAEHIASVESLELSFDKDTRRLTVTFRAITTWGEALDQTLEALEA